MRIVKHRYDDKTGSLLNEILRNTQLINSVKEAIFPDDLLTGTIVEIGSSTWEKIFLLNDMLKHEIAIRKLWGYTGWSMDNPNTKAVLMALNKIFHEDGTASYSIVFDDIPGLSLPVDELFEAKQLKEKLIYKTRILYKSVVLYK
jgi:hypothetical protein